MRLLWLLPYRPWPQDHGGKIRAFAVLRGMAERGARVDAWYPSDPRDVELLPPAVPGISWHAYPSRLGVGRHVKAISLATPWPVQVRAVMHQSLQRHVRDRAGEYDAVVLDQIYQFPLVRDLPKATPLVVVAHNVEHRLASQLAASAPRLETRMVFGVDARKLRRLEQSAFARADHVVAVSTEDASLMESMTSTPVTVRPNGVDLDEFSFHPPRSGRGHRMLMTGMLGYPPNHEAALRIRDEILPRVRRDVPAAHVDIVGSRCPPELSDASAPDRGFHVVGWVDDVLPEFRKSDVFLMPLTMGGGTRLKALQAMSCGVPIVSTRQGVEGLDVEDGVHVLIAESSTGLAEACVTLLRDPALRRRVATQARRLVEQHYSWTSVNEGMWRDLLAVTGRPG